MQRNFSPMHVPPGKRHVVVFDLGGVLLDWNPRYLYRKLFAGDDVAMEDFLATVCTEEWNERQDAGRSFADAVAELLPRHADKAELIERMSLGTGLRCRAKAGNPAG